MNKLTGQYCHKEINHIQQSIADILVTPIGSRVMRRHYGSILPLLIDQPLSHALFLQIASASIVAINRWEPRVKINRIHIMLEHSQVIAIITLTVKKNNESVQYTQLLGAKS